MHWQSLFSLRRLFMVYYLILYNYIVNALAESVISASTFYGEHIIIYNLIYKIRQ